MSFAASLISLAILVGAAVEDLDQEQILQRHSKSVERLKRCSVTTEERRLITRADSTSEKLYSVRTCQIRLDHQRSNLLVHEVSYPGIDPALPPSDGNVNEFNYVSDKQVLQIYYPHQSPDVRPSAPAGIMGRLTPNQDNKFILDTVGDGGIAFGHVTFNSPIPVSRLMALSKNTRGSKDEIGYRIDGIGSDGTQQTIWFDPAAGFHVKQVRFEQSGATLSDNRFRHNRRALMRYGFAEGQAVDLVTYEVRNVQFSRDKDAYVIAGLETFKTIHATDGSQAVEHTIYKMTDWSIEPDFADSTSFQPLLPIPEGTPVQVFDSESLGYVYKDGIIQLAVNKKTVDRLIQVKMSNRPSVPKMQWLWAVVAGVLGLVWWRMRAGA